MNYLQTPITNYVKHQWICTILMCTQVTQAQQHGDHVLHIENTLTKEDKYILVGGAI